MAAITSAAIGAASAGYQIYQGAQQKKDAKNALNDYERQELTNAFEDIPISTLGSDIITEGNNQASANAIDAIQNAGDRAIIGGAGRVVNANNTANQEARAYLDNQIIKRAYETANDERRIQGVRENRDIANIDALSSSVQAGDQNIWSGMRGLGSAVNYGLNNYSPTSQARNEMPVDTMNPKGMTVDTNPSAPFMSQRNYYDPFANIKLGGF